MSHNNGLQACFEAVLTILPELDVEYFLFIDVIANSAGVRPQVVFLDVPYNQRTSVLLEQIKIQ